MKSEQQIKIDILREGDLTAIIKEFSFPWTSPEATRAKWEGYLVDQNANKRIVCLAKLQDRLVGYGSLLQNSEYSNLRSRQIPEIHDVWISEEYRGHGFGQQLICRLEYVARKENHQTVGIGVGLYKDYGRAQRLYIQLGYVPDGEGVTYKYRTTTPGHS